MAVIDIKANGSRWFTDEVLQLIDTVKSCECLYNPKHKNYFCRPVVENLWKEIDIKLGKSPGASLSKWTNLRICFRREYTTFLKEKTKPYWAFFDNMFFLHAFLRRKRPVVGRLEGHIQEALEKVSSITRGNFKNYVEHVENIESYEDDEEVEEENRWNNSSLVKKENFDDENEQDFEDESFENDQPAHGSFEELTIPSQSSQIADTADKALNYKCIPTATHQSTRSFSEYGKLMPSSTTHDDSNLSKKNICNENTYTFRHKNMDMQQNTCAASESTKNVVEDEENTADTRALNNSLCKCKVDSDAMFLMSLLPDIQTLSRKDRGRFKIETQKLIQNLLYPEEK